MSRRVAALFGIALFALADCPAFAQLEKAPVPKRVRPKPPSAEADLAKAALDPDFGVQGEYEETSRGGTPPIGYQVVALGGSKFTVRAFGGGLPGAGWDGKPPLEFTAERRPEGVTVRSSGGPVVGRIQSGRLLWESGDPSAPRAANRVERKSPTLGAKPPEGAVVLFAGPGDETANWVNGKLLELSDGQFLLAGPTTKQPVGAFHAHIEFRTPWMPTARGQQRGNSGVYVQQRYEVQVLDSFGLEGKNNECGALYTQTSPKVNMCLPPLVWQTYDIDFTPAKYDAAGKKTAPARITLAHNGVTVHDNAELPTQTGHGKKEDATPGPIVFQDHRSPVAYRNVWLIEKK